MSTVTLRVKHTVLLRAALVASIFVLGLVLLACSKISFLSFLLAVALASYSPIRPLASKIISGYRAYRIGVQSGSESNKSTKKKNVVIKTNPIEEDEQ